MTRESRIMTIDGAIGANLRELRRAARLNQTELAAILRSYTDESWSRESISQRERGNRRFEVGEVYVLAFIFGVPVTRLIVPAEDIDIVTIRGIGIRNDDELMLDLYTDPEGSTGQDTRSFDTRKARATESVIDQLYLHSPRFDDLKDLADALLSARRR